MKRIAIYATVPDDTDPSEMLDTMTAVFVEGMDMDEDAVDVTVYDPAPKEEA